MYWTYGFHPQLFQHNLIIHPIFNSPTIEKIQITPQIPPSTPTQMEKQQNIPNFNCFNLTKEDLTNYGYSNNKKLWTEDQDERLKYLAIKHQMDWNLISQSMPNRTPKMCYSRHRRLENTNKNYWKKSQDKIILNFISQNGQNWKALSDQLPGRTAKQIKEHYMNYLRQDISKQQWNIDDDLKLLQLLQEHGTNWKLIQVSMKGRTQNQIKNRYFGRLRKIINKKMDQPDVNTQHICQNLQKT